MTLTVIILIIIFLQVLPVFDIIKDRQFLINFLIFLTVQRKLYLSNSK